MKYMMIVCYDPTIERVDDDNDIDSWVSEMTAGGCALRGTPWTRTTRPRSGCGTERCWSRTGHSPRPRK